MQVKVKDLSAEIELKNKGMELEIRDNDGIFLGDLVITRASIIWCEGKTGRDRGIKVSMTKFLDMMRGEAPAKKAVKKAAKKTV